MDIKELADLVGNKGCTMVPAHLAGGIASRNFKGIQLFALDFDHGCKFDEIKNKCEDFGISISFAYHTFSSSVEEERFRVVFAYECLIEDAFVAGVISYMLTKIFPECDGQCKNPDRMFFWGKGSCRLLDEFRRGVTLPHEARFAILTNLLHVSGGQKLFMDVTETFYGEKEYDKWLRDVKYMKGYHSCRCSGSFCLYYDSCENAGTIVDTLALDRKVYRTEERYYSCEEALECLVDNLQKAFVCHWAGVHLIKAQTALGKTTAYINLIRNNPGKKFLIALPTNILKEQVAEDLISYNLLKEDVFVTASVKGNCFIPDDIRRLIEDMHKCGIHDQTKKILKARYDEIKNSGLCALIEEYKKLLAGISAVKDERVVVTTHAFFLQMPEEFLKQYTIIIDEDILQLQLFNRICSVSTECLEELVEKRIPVFCDVAKEMLQAELNQYRKINVLRRYPMRKEELEKLEYFDKDDNINDLLDAKTFVRLKNRYTENEEIKYFCPQKLHPLKYIVLSATLNEKMYRAYFEDDMKVYMYPEKKAAYKGKLI